MKKKLKTAAAKVHWAEYAEIDYDKFFTVLKNLRAERRHQQRPATSFSKAGISLKIWAGLLILRKI